MQTGASPQRRTSVIVAGPPWQTTTSALCDLGLKLGVVQECRTLAVNRRARRAVLDEDVVLGMPSAYPSAQSTKPLKGMIVGSDRHQDAAHSSGPDEHGAGIQVSLFLPLDAEQGRAGPAQPPGERARVDAVIHLDVDRRNALPFSDDEVWVSDRCTS